MILVSSNKYADAMALLKEARELVMNSAGAERKDDEQLARVDDLYNRIIELLKPSTDG